MKRRPRPPIIRKTIKWGGAAVTVLLVVVWIGSAWWSVSYAGPCWTGNERFSVGFESGTYRVNHAWGNAALEYPEGWSLDRANEPFACWFSIENTGRFWLAVIPIWMLIAVASVIALGVTCLTFLYHLR